MKSIIAKLIKIFKYYPNDPNEGLNILEYYVSYFHIMASKSFTDYWLRKVSVKRSLITLFFNLNLLISALKFLIIAYFDNTFVKILFADISYLFVKPVVLLLMAGILFLGYSFVGIVLNLFFKIKIKCNL
jgi:hypothetical protein